MRINNILVFSNTLQKGGAEIQAIELVKVLSSRYNLWFALFYGKEVNEDIAERLQGYRVKLIHFSGNKFAVFFELAFFLIKNKIDCIYSFLATTNFYSSIVGRICGVPFIIGGIRSSVYVGFKLIIQRALHNHLMTLTISNNYCAVDSLALKGYKREKFHVIQNVFPEPPRCDYRRVESDLLTIITVARFTYEKDYDTALKSIYRLKNNYSGQFRYLIIGYGKLESQIRNRITHLQLDSYVDIIVNPKNVFQYLINSDIYLSTSLFEGVSNSILEAMYAKLPIVATNVGDNSYMVKENNGFLVPVQDDDSISDKLEVLLKDKNLRQKMGELSKQYLSDNFSLEKFSNENYDILNMLENE